ncbi:pantothenate synthetase PanC [Methyloglobulus morosus KoM1]|uniref:Pantothenate synthetase n=1 Tax=Methyloglobulus morosus KoM1 TaxID=1116472 RepID=V5BXR8_9GAMM|nr:pantoate--beta-alanine ligase [Methyloglobulus morosus]ESS72634.1 pantothenate synthetase PanC [Methyloglobulus morosus KoM1]
MQVTDTIINVRNAVKTWRMAGARIAFVPTMGNLHIGHLKLVEEAQKSADRVAVSIFVNPTQFGVGEDFEAYPRTEAEDKQKLDDAGVDLLFLPSVGEMYGNDAKTVVSVKNLSNLHCGASRPGHFDGVATVVCKFLNIVQPDIGFLGQKDFQQLAVIRKMVNDLNIPVEIRPVETVRESSGLALSSRNGYLSPEELRVAPKLYQALCAARDGILMGKKGYSALEDEAVIYLQEAGFVPDYFSVCRVGDLLKADKQDTDLVVLAAAKLGRTRLIDNIRVSTAR